MKLLKTYEVREDIFNKILYDYEVDVRVYDSIKEFMTGYAGKMSKRIIAFNGSDEMILQEYILNGYCNNIVDCTDWKQVRLIKVQNAKTEVSNSTNGQHAWNIIHSMLRKVYSEDEIIDCINSCQAEYDEDYKQFHYEPTRWLDNGELKVIDNCYKYDINGAHTDALCEIFPKAKDLLLKMYEKRKKEPKYKKYCNFFVGMLKRKGYDKTYNWIVQRTTKTLYAAMDEVGGTLLYANTDGFLITCPNKLLNTSKALGQFKLEHAGKSYFYRDKNYWIMQNDDEKTGSCLNSVRDLIDLPNNKIVHYDQQLDKTLGYRYAINIREDYYEENSN